MKLVNKHNKGVVDVSNDYSKVLLANKATWIKKADYLKEQEAEAEPEAEADAGAGAEA